MYLYIYICQQDVGRVNNVLKGFCYGNKFVETENLKLRYKYSLNHSPWAENTVMKDRFKKKPTTMQKVSTRLKVDQKEWL